MARIVAGLVRGLYPPQAKQVKGDASARREAFLLAASDTSSRHGNDRQRA